MLFKLARRSTPFILTLLPHPVSHRAASMSTLATYLAEIKHAFLSDAQQSRGHEWTIVMGNEAGGTCVLRILTISVLTSILYRPRQPC